MSKIVKCPSCDCHIVVNEKGDTVTKGIADFKKGLNPEMYELVGEWRRLF